MSHFGMYKKIFFYILILGAVFLLIPNFSYAFQGDSIPLLTKIKINESEFIDMKNKGGVWVCNGTMVSPVQIKKDDDKNYAVLYQYRRYVEKNSNCSIYYRKVTSKKPSPIKLEENKVKGNNVSGEFLKMVNRFLKSEDSFVNFHVASKGPLSTCIEGNHSKKNVLSLKICVYPRAKIMDIKYDVPPDTFMCRRLMKKNYTSTEAIEEDIGTYPSKHSYLPPYNAYKVPVYGSSDTKNNLFHFHLAKSNELNNGFLMVKFNSDTSKKLLACIDTEIKNTLLIRYQQVRYENKENYTNYLNLVYSPFYKPLTFDLGPKISLQEVNVTPSFDASLIAISPEMRRSNTEILFHPKDVSINKSSFSLSYLMPNKEREDINVFYSEKYEAYRFKQKVYYEGNTFLFPFDSYKTKLYIQDAAVVSNETNITDYAWFSVKSKFEGKNSYIEVRRNSNFYIVYFIILTGGIVIFWRMRKRINKGDLHVYEFLPGFYPLVNFFFVPLRIQYFLSINTLIYAVLFVCFVIAPLINKRNI